MIELCPLGPPNGIVLRHFDGLDLEDLEGIMHKLGVVVIGTWCVCVCVRVSVCM